VVVLWVVSDKMENGYRIREPMRLSLGTRIIGSVFLAIAAAYMPLPSWSDGWNFESMEKQEKLTGEFNNRIENAGRNCVDDCGGLYYIIGGCDGN